MIYYSGMDALLNATASFVRGVMRWPAMLLNTATGGRVTPNHITLISLLGHFFVLYELWQSRPLVAALLLAIFGLMDSLDGALARLQNSSSATGILFDSVSDRVKEVILFIGLAIFMNSAATSEQLLYTQQSLFNTPQVSISVWLPVAVCGMSLVVSYIRARGETILQGYAVGEHHTPKTSNHTNAQVTHQVNKVFTGGIARYEVRMAIVIVGLITGHLTAALLVLLLLVSITALQRTAQAYRALKHV